MLEWVRSLVDTLGYPGILLVMFLEVIIPFVPSEIIMPLAGFPVNRGTLNFLGVVLAGTIGSTVGAVIYYYLGKIIGSDRLVVLADKYGKWLTLSGKDVRKANRWFERHGSKVVFFCRFVPGIRSKVSIPAGVAQMNMLPFLLYTFGGTFIWNSAMTYAGYVLGQNYALVDTYMGHWGTGILGALGVLVLIWYAVRLMRQIRRKKQDPQDQLQDPPSQWRAASPPWQPQQQRWEELPTQPQLPSWFPHLQQPLREPQPPQPLQPPSQPSSWISQPQQPQQTWKPQFQPRQSWPSSPARQPWSAQPHQQMGEPPAHHPWGSHPSDAWDLHQPQQRQQARFSLSPRQQSFSESETHREPEET